MIDALCTKPLLGLLDEAMNRGKIKGWSVDGPHVVLYRGKEAHKVLPLTASAILREVLSQPDFAQGKQARIRFQILE